MQIEEKNQVPVYLENLILMMLNFIGWHWLWVSFNFLTDGIYADNSVLLFSFWKFGRYLKHLDYDVYYVRNFTDVDDKVSGFC